MHADSFEDTIIIMHGNACVIDVVSGTCSLKYAVTSIYQPFGLARIVNYYRCFLHKTCPEMWPLAIPYNYTGQYTGCPRLTFITAGYDVLGVVWQLKLDYSYILWRVE